MKTFKSLTLALSFVLLFLSSSFAQDAVKLDKVAIKTFFHCANGKALIEKEMLKVDGVKEVIADLETKVVTIKFDVNKQSKESLNKAIETIGYKTELSVEGTEIKKACNHEDGEHKEEHHKE
ncbi:MAG: hypothetical protein A2W98_05975 [Bacteroidetes bacterium GWF2_33_38]|nr:MAG: hypothetical protein A2W98_05975 [Bacteroidetes bacterium GWF2_33_38]OFY74234.1 MAG: hypothetical protein A2265_00710 [Bacteroidetes bacterium RIFOXYA12_FULL_33_9]OFY91956.1 MAG: hypothetical protein A2236_02175 [Bacteroidetes bacterium RIFOXYA2_FULL_33_7]HBX49593.1 hypothetical protein [Bacteroidales bacterium]